MPTERFRVIKGRPDIMGRVREMLDPNEVEEAVLSLRGAVDAIAVSGYASVRNPEHEIYVKERVRELLNVPVVCAHELTTTLGFYDRTVTAALNARLIPMISDLIDSVKSSMSAFEINAPLMIVKGDGTLMTEECARDKPIETILSGPAASVIGGMFLSGEQNAIVLDMGGTTTDLIHLTDGHMRLNNEGANVGGWTTHIRAAEIYTVGVGGDSRIYLDSSRNVKIGPQKVIPYCMAGAWFPLLHDELRRIYVMEEKPYRNFWRNEAEAYILSRQGDYSLRPQEEQRVIEAIRKGPHTLYYLQKECGEKNVSRILEKLSSEDIVGRIAITPTDLQHAAGEYQKWNQGTSELCIRILAEQLGLDVPECILMLRKRIQHELVRACIYSGYYFDNRSLPKDAPAVIDYFIEDIFQTESSEVLGGKLFLKKPVVAIGAPAHAWTKCVEEMLDTRVVIPEHAEVANAVGAAVGLTVDTAELLIRFDAVSKKYVLFSQESRKAFDKLDEATEAAERLGRRLAAAYLPGDGFEITCDCEDVCMDDPFTGEKHLIERQIRVTAAAGFEKG